MTSTFGSDISSRVKWILDILNESDTKQFRLIFENDVTATILAKEEASRTNPERLMLEKDERAYEWLLSKIPQKIKREVVGRTPTKVSGHALMMKLFSVLEVENWDMDRILEQEEKDDDEDFGTYFARLLSMMDLQEAEPPIKKIITRVLGSVPTTIQDTPEYKMATKGIVKQWSKNKTQTMTLASARELCEEIDEIVEAAPKVKANRAGLGKHQPKERRDSDDKYLCRNRWCDKSDGHLFTKCKFTQCKSCGMMGHIARECKKE